ncbi:conserved hypothetical protein [Theileria orientalis strain Shintoku]|uniref:Nuclear speckle splicing regulatory protein 1 N-terminal domain-containing protein n=1 Tax=Theileria orientalis strain Shintoku TaxID=869250 RepID=J4DQ12_THEOR|nr:conserved hypothetical protein [Theileria orientalis strain Shintoku]BAM41649.1 conserved hypothetical protein [Theileria orientalis strain Shintoku]|eukprot:XP_009691950.1 conserved hypothetical protein [Theileria orientalis strain Shintoku]
MKIVLKTSNSIDKNDTKTDVKKVSNDADSTRRKSADLSHVFGAKNDNDAFYDKIDGKHLLSKAKLSSSDHSSDPLRSIKLYSKSLDSVSDIKPDSDLDPQLYLYDEFVEDKDEDAKKLTYLGFVEESNRDSASDAAVETKESLYLDKMVSTAKKRQMERDIAFEKQLLREELKAVSEVGEVFVTGAYKKKLEERRRFEEEQRNQDEYDALHSKNSLTKLHSYLLNSGLAKRSTKGSK